jgi:hypothetical protein
MPVPDRTPNLLSAAFIAVVLSVLALLVSFEMGGQFPELNMNSGGGAHNEVIPISKLEPLFSEETLSFASSIQGLPNPFETEYFAPKPKPKPKPKPPEGQKFSLTYLGFFESSQGVKEAFIRIDGTTQSLSLESSLLKDHKLKSMETSKAVIVDGANNATELPFRESRTVEVRKE